MLLVGGDPIAFNWPDCEGSIMQYLARAGASNFEQSLHSLRHLLDGHLRADVPIHVQLHTLLQLFVSRQYQLHFVAECRDYDFITYDSKWWPDQDSDHFYPLGHTLVYTQPVDSLKFERIERYRKNDQ